MRSFIFTLVFVVFNGAQANVGHCPERDSCTFNSKQAIPGCYCDHDCFVYNDCCKQYIINNPNNVSLISSVLQENCIPLTNEDTKSDRKGVFMVDKCLKTKTSCNANNSDMQSLLPVSYGNITYINADCAVCNDIDNIRVWNIVFVIHDIEELVVEEGENGTYGNLNRNDTLDKILSPRRNSLLYYLLPPNEITPRYCPYEIWDDTKHRDREENNHQNMLRCNRKSFKNYELCYLDGCCKNGQVVCITMYPLNNSYSGQKGLFSTRSHVFFDFSDSLQESNSFHKEFNTILSLNFQGTQVSFMIKVGSSINTSISYDNCIQSVIAYLKATEYEITLKYGSYIALYREAEYIFIFECVSPLRLSPTQVNYLLHYRASIRYINRSTRFQASISLMALRMSYLTPLLGGGKKRFRKENTEFQTSSNVVPTCHNVSLILKKDQQVRTVEIECLDKKDGSEKYTGGCSPRVTTIRQAVALCLITLVLNEAL